MRRGQLSLTLVVCWTSMASGQNIEIHLTPDEFTAFQSAVWNGSRTYGVPTEYRVHLPHSQPQSPITMVKGEAANSPIWSLWMGELSRDVMAGLDFNNLTDEAKHTLGVVQSVNRKLAEAKANPIYEPITLDGRVNSSSDSSADPSAQIRTIRFELDAWNEAIGSWTAELAGPLANELHSERWLNKPLVLTGYVKTPGTLELARVIEKKTDTLEIVTMSQCPFGLNAIKGALDELESDGLAVLLTTSHLRNLTAADDKALQPTSPIHDPAKLEIRYLFYKNSPPALKDGQTGPLPPESPWWCMHGEGELHENLVQMLIRDRHADFFFAYLRARLEQPTIDWKSVARLAGLDSEAIRGIESAIASDRDAIIQAEHDYVAGLHGITDGSPTWIWESRIVPDIRRIKRFKDLNPTGGSCAGSH